MEKLRHEWIAEFESVPPGNGTESDRWASTVGEAARTAMSTSERDAHEEKNLKLRKAIADQSLHDESEANDSKDAERRRKLDAAVANGDWSSVIDEQTE
jgi:hypothetical protein